MSQDILEIEIRASSYVSKTYGCIFVGIEFNSIPPFWADYSYDEFKECLGTLQQTVRLVAPDLAKESRNTEPFGYCSLLSLCQALSAKDGGK